MRGAGLGFILLATATVSHIICGLSGISKSVWVSPRRYPFEVRFDLKYTNEYLRYFHYDDNFIRGEYIVVTAREVEN
ncbi:hypothetical protein FACS1894217_12060 [Clostridia bacterium]|nr:hypothetical protein FACS1894217_12060 [Clostridia bacterium]